MLCLPFILSKSHFPDHRQDSILTFYSIHLAMQYVHSSKILREDNELPLVISSLFFISVFTLTIYLTCFLSLCSCYNLIYLSVLLYPSPSTHTDTHTCSCTHTQLEQLTSLICFISPMLLYPYTPFHSKKQKQIKQTAVPSSYEYDCMCIK